MAQTLEKSDRKPILLLVDDDAIISDSLEYMLENEYQVMRASDRQSSFELLDAMTQAPELALVDLGLPPDIHTPDEGLAVIKQISQQYPATRVLVLSGQDNQENMSLAKSIGAVDFISKPCDIAEIKARLKKHSQQKNETQRSDQIEGLVGQSEAIELLRMQITQLANSPYPVLIEGESGSGKEITAKNLHLCSFRKSKPFLTLNCAAFNGELLESQLFGHAKGSFTGATETKKGFFEEAGSGTLLLDEVADIPLDLQAKLLRVLEDGEFYRIGETRPRHASTRVLAATNKNLYQAVDLGNFREDLYHRLSVLTILVPSLQQRSDDKLLLLEHFSHQVVSDGHGFSLDQDSSALWEEYSFPGNVRELRNIVIRLSTKYPGQTVRSEALMREMNGLRLDINILSEDEKWLKKTLKNDEFQLDQVLNRLEKKFIELALQRHHGNMSHAAKMLGINRTTLYGRIDRFEDKN